MGLIESRLEAAFDQMEPVGAHVLNLELVRRSAVEGAEIGDRSGVHLQRIRRHVAEGHVVEHALPKRRNRLVHRLDSLCWRCDLQRSTECPTSRGCDRGRSGNSGYIAEVILCDVSGMALLSPIPCCRWKVQMPKQPSPQPIADTEVRALLDRHQCPVPFHEVRTRFLGNIATPALSASPIKIVEGL